MADLATFRLEMRRQAEDLASRMMASDAGQRLLARLSREIPPAVEAALVMLDADRQAFSPMLAILSARHETQYSRLFRS